MRIFEFRNRIRIFERNTNIRIFEHSLTSLKKRVCVKILDFEHFRDVLDFDLWPHPWHGPLGQMSWNES